MTARTNHWATLSEQLRRKGVRLTRPRRLVVEKLLAAKDHLSADAITDQLHREGARISKASVYRTLALLKETGLFDEHDFGRGSRLYEPMFGRAHHDHLYCIQCGRIFEFVDPEIERHQDLVTRRYRFEAVYHSHKIFGYCEVCRKRKKR